MTASRREVLGAGAAMAAVLCLPRTASPAGKVVEITMDGRRDGSRVWFDPVGLHVERGQTVRWVNRDVGNSHTATAYHPANGGRPRRIPEAAEPWDSGYLMPGETFSIVLLEEGVFDYYCIPHEMAGMVGRIVVGAEPQDWRSEPHSAEGLPGAAMDAFPSVEEIVRKGRLGPA